jgi:UDP-3-O-[3-hydroxymyristoyl] glucosamine N-acyltransferase
VESHERFYLKDIATHLTGDYTGPSEIACTHLASPHDDPIGALVLCFERQYIQRSEQAGIIGCVTTVELSQLIPPAVPTIIITNPAEALTKLLGYFERPTLVTRGVFHHSASIDPTSEVHPSVHIGAHCVIGPRCNIGRNVQIHAGVIIEADVQIGEGCIIHSRAVLMHTIEIGKQVRVGPGCVIGAEGFSIDQHKLRPHIGSVRIGDHCTMGANSCIDRGTIGLTRIGNHTHLDNLVQVGHNAQIGNHVIICGQVGIAGGAIIEDAVVLGGQSGIAQGVRVESNVQVAAQSGVTKQLASNGRYSGHPAEPNLNRLKRLAAIKRLVETSES